MSLFQNSINNPQNSFYTFVGRPYPWPNDAAPPVANNSLIQYEQSIFGDLVYGKLVQSTDVKPMIVRNNWVANTVYDAYDQTDGELFNNANFYVFTDENKVFKCIFNAEGGPSTIKPILASTSGVFSTSDGYIWKYMFTIDSTSQSKFSSNNYLVVLPNTSVESSASPGALDYIRVDQPGQQYTAINVDYLANYVNTGVVELAQSASTVDNIYTNSAIYFYSGPGANQLRNVKHYDGLNRLVYVDHPLDGYITAQIANTAGSILVGQTLFQQYDSVSILYKNGYFNIGDSVSQSDTGAVGTVIGANSSVLTVQRAVSAVGFSLDLPIYNTITAGTTKPGNAYITTGSANVVGIGTTFTDTANGYIVGDYIRVGSNTAYNIRRVSSVVNNVFLTVNTAFNQTLTANSHVKVPNAFKPNSLTVNQNIGTITHVNFSGIQVTYSNNSISADYIPGESVTMVDVNNVNQGANGIVAYANSSTLIVSDVNGVFSNTFYISGSSSSQKSKIVDILSFPSVTVKSDARTFFSGQLAFSADTISTSPSGNLVIVSSHSIPNGQTQYRIGPAVSITGDGSNASAYAIVNTSSHSSYGISSIQMIDGGSNYTWSNATIVANSLYGAGATIVPIVGPVDGHGANTLLDLGARYLCVSTQFDTFINDSYRLGSSGTYRRLGIIKNPEFDDVILTVSNTTYTKLTLSSTIGTFVVDEIILQPTSNAAGIIVVANSTFIEVKNSQGTFLANTAGDNIRGLTSAATANTRIANTVQFAILSNTESIIQSNTLATGILEQVISNTSLKLTSAVGRFSNGFSVSDPTINAHAKVVGISIANGNIDQTSGYGQYFNQTSRVTLSSNTAPFSLYEQVTQEISNAYGYVFDSSGDLDVSFASANGTFSLGNSFTDNNTGATATVIAANSTYLKLTNVSGAIRTADTFINNLSKGATITGVYPVLKLYGSTGKIQNGNYRLFGNTSGAIADVAFANTIVYPNLVKNSGEVIYIDNIVPFTKTAASKEVVRLVLKF
jgi:hypothetical protein